MDFRFYECLVVAPPVILGEQLLPLSIGQHALLTAIESPFVTEGKPEISLTDCVFAIGICSRKFDDARLWLLDHALDEKTFALLGSKNPTDTLGDIVVALFEYMKAYTLSPRFWNMPGRKSSRLPVHLRLISTLRLPETEAWDYGFALAQWHYVANNHELEKILRPDNLQAQIDQLKAWQEAENARRSHKIDVVEPKTAPDAQDTSKDEKTQPASNLSERGVHGNS